MRKNLILLSLFLCLTALGQPAGTADNGQKGVTFTVDENLPKPESSAVFSQKGMAENLLRKHGVDRNTLGLVASSFDSTDVALLGKDNFYRTIVRAYAEHCPLVLSPDMIWLMISQGFSRYVNENPELMRKKMVDHDGKIDLMVESGKDVLNDPGTDWAALVGGFTKQIEANSSKELVDVIRADFSTTGTDERLASEITLMDAVEQYFDYAIIMISCGIPYITLEGTADDWEKVLAKTRELEKYGLGWWTDELVPVIQEFVAAAKGTPDRAFWKDIVMKDRPDRLRGGGCSNEKPTELDGWFLKFFPDMKKRTCRTSVSHLKAMEPDMVRVPLKYHILAPDGTVMSTTDMELWAGFVGATVDSATCALRPHIGWVVRKAETDDEIAETLKEQDDGFGGIMINVKTLPEALRRLSRIQSLYLTFTDDVVIPEWFYKMKVENLSISGRVSDETKRRLLRHFPKANIKQTQKNGK